MNVCGEPDPLMAQRVESQCLLARPPPPDLRPAGAGAFGHGVDAQRDKTPRREQLTRCVQRPFALGRTQAGAGVGDRVGAG